jgi:hypothetical protein
MLTGIIESKNSIERNLPNIFVEKEVKFRSE